MNIWIISEGEPLPIDGENVRLRRMGQLSELLSSSGHEVHWFCSTYHHYQKYERYAEDTDIKVKNNFYIHMFKGRAYRKNVSFSRMRHHRILSNKFGQKSTTLEKPDVILATLAPLELSEAAVDYANNSGVPVVVDVRDLWPEIYYEVVPKWAKPIISPYIKYSYARLKRSLQKTTGIIGITAGFVNYGLDIAGIEKRATDKVFQTSYNRNEHDEDLFEDHWGHFGLSKNDFIVAFVGNFGIQFVIEPVIKTAKRLEEYCDIKFVLCGVGANYEYIREATKLTPNVIMPGWIEEKEIKSLLQNSKVGVAPYRQSRSFELSVPNKYGEYIAYGLPVLVSVDGEMKKLSEDYSCGYFYSSSDELMRHILEIYSDPEKQKKMANNAKELYEEMFNSRNVYTKFSEYLVHLALPDINKR